MYYIFPGVFYLFLFFLSLEENLGRSWLLLLWENIQFVKVTLDVTICQSFAVLHTKNLTHRCIWVDGVALLGVLELVRVDIRRERTSHIRWGHLRALGLVQEAAEVILQRDRGSEDGRTLLLWDAVLILLLGTTATTTSLLDLLRNTLLELLERLDRGNRLITLRLEDGNQSRNLLVNRLGLRRWGLDRNSRSHWGNGDGGSNGGRSDWLGSGLLGNGGSSDWGGDFSNGGIGLLGDLLGGGGGVLAHCTSTGGSI
jgi:uncharacterized membrane protein YgcG